MREYDVGMRQVLFYNVDSIGYDEAQQSRKYIHKDKYSSL